VAVRGVWLCFLGSRFFGLATDCDSPQDTARAKQWLSRFFFRLPPHESFRKIACADSREAAISIFQSNSAVRRRLLIKAGNTWIVTSASHRRRLGVAGTTRRHDPRPGRCRFGALGGPSSSPHFCYFGCRCPGNVWRRSLSWLPAAAGGAPLGPLCERDGASSFLARRYPPGGHLRPCLRRSWLGVNHRGRVAGGQDLRPTTIASRTCGASRPMKGIILPAGAARACTRITPARFTQLLPFFDKP